MENHGEPTCDPGDIFHSGLLLLGNTFLDNLRHTNVQKKLTESCHLGHYVLVMVRDSTWRCFQCPASGTMVQMVPTVPGCSRASSPLEIGGATFASAPCLLLDPGPMPVVPSHAFPERGSQLLRHAAGTAWTRKKSSHLHTNIKHAIDMDQKNLAGLASRKGPSHSQAGIQWRIYSSAKFAEMFYL